jgi:hypothetical protein
MVTMQPIYEEGWRRMTDRQERYRRSADQRRWGLGRIRRTTPPDEPGVASRW